jgi:hypothetical protein
VSGGVYAHGYVMIGFSGAVAKVDYFQGTDDEPSYTETIPTAAA